MTVTALNAMTLGEAAAWLASFGYEPDWTTEQLKEAAAHFSPEDRQKTVAALRISAAACRHEAQSIEGEGA